MTTTPRYHGRNVRVVDGDLVIAAGNSGPQIAEQTLPAHCWCQRHRLIVPQAMVKRGETMSCGRRDCRGPKGQHDVGDRYVGKTYSFVRSTRNDLRKGRS